VLWAEQIDSCGTVCDKGKLPLEERAISQANFLAPVEVNQRCIAQMIDSNNGLQT
jgi:hypothetical protein